MSLPRPTILLLALLAAMAFAPAAARASDSQLSIMMDDDLLVYRGDQVRDATLERMKALGVDYVRVTMLWSVVADKARSTKARDRRFRRLGADDPRAYPEANWDRYDRLARATQTLGMGLYLDVTFPGPSWGHEKAPRSQRRLQRTWKPKPGQFEAFVKAVGRRYTGTYPDGNDARANLPRINFWALGNEPNQGGWLTPQWSGGRAASPVLYRKLYAAGHRALVSTGHGQDTILVGETAPLGVSRRTATSAMYPKAFIRSFFKGGKRVDASAWAHHPYTKDLGPTERDKSSQSITMANFNDLGVLLDQMAASTKRVRAGMPIISTEFGYETNPPDPFRKTTLDQQAEFNELGDYLAFINPRVIGQTQFLLRDVLPQKRYKPGSKQYWFTYQSGLYTADDQPKPSVQTYSLPFLAVLTDAATLGYWGQLRFRPNNQLPDFFDRVQLQFKPADGSTDWTNYRDPIVVTNAKGFFIGTIERPPAAGQIRATWSGADFPFTAESRPVNVPAP
jgi:hypothetical protein